MDKKLRCPFCNKEVEGNEREFSMTVAYSMSIIVSKGEVYSNNLQNRLDDIIDEPYFHETCGQPFAQFKEEGENL